MKGKCIKMIMNLERRIKNKEVIKKKIIINKKYEERNKRGIPFMVHRY